MSVGSVGQYRSGEFQGRQRCERWIFARAFSVGLIDDRRSRCGGGVGRLEESLSAITLFQLFYSLMRLRSLIWEIKVRTDALMTRSDVRTCMRDLKKLSRNYLGAIVKPMRLMCEALGYTLRGNSFDVQSAEPFRAEALTHTKTGVSRLNQNTVCP